jgi:hypothetical protein
MCYCLSAGGIGVSADLWRSLSKLHIVTKLMMYELQSMCFMFCSHYQHSISLSSVSLSDAPHMKDFALQLPDYHSDLLDRFRTWAAPLLPPGMLQSISLCFC